jgi:ADP-ribose pyrophosphatase YjhB (NUDIX family)
MRREGDQPLPCYVPDGPGAATVRENQLMSYQPHLFPVSVKGVVIRDGRVLLLRNEREEWELPGGKLEIGEDPPACVAREIAEETGWPVTTGPLLDVWQYHIRDGVDVLIVTYSCRADTDAEPVVSHEHKQAAMFTEAEITDLRMPDGYKTSIARCYAVLNARVS